MPNNSWTTQEIETLKEKSSMGIKELAGLLKKTNGAIFAKAWQLGIKISRIPKLWTKERVDILINNYWKYGGEYCAKLLNLSNKQIMNQARALNLKYLAQSKPNFRFCKVCLEEKNFIEYHKHKSKKFGISDTCKTCSKIKKDESRKNNPELRRQQKRRYYLKHRDQIKIKNKKNRHRQSERRRERYRNDIDFKIKKDIRNLIGKWLKNKKTQKFCRTEELLGCSLEEFKNWMSIQFSETMTWENHAHDTWHIDHIIPSWVFDGLNKEEIAICWNYRNLQPLSATQNLSLKHASLFEAKNHLLRKIKEFGTCEQYIKMLSFLEEKIKKYEP